MILSLGTGIQSLDIPVDCIDVEMRAISGITHPVTHINRGMTARHIVIKIFHVHHVSLSKRIGKLHLVVQEKRILHTAPTLRFSEPSITQSVECAHSKVRYSSYYEPVQRDKKHPIQ
jgi:hypothetical protein